ncbi:MAG TPA: hypothetical protein VK203_06155 [Nostocaceae cyanobacterium]|nr:hypothetical protein [Nostocaceae cyanobacterium]
MHTVQEVLQQCTVNSLVVKLPDIQFEREFYEQIAAALKGIGGKWNKSKKGFVFKHDPSELLNRIANGEQINLQQDYQFVPTPDNLVDKLLEIAVVGLTEQDILQPQCFLEPSGGDGQIIKGIFRAIANKFPKIKLPSISTYELMERNRVILQGIPNVNLLGEDFLKANEQIKYQRIIANPPFSGHQDIDHVYKMWSCLAKPGRLVTITSQSWVKGSDWKSEKFREWLEFVKAHVITIPHGSFKETPVGGCILVIDKGVTLGIPKIEFEEPNKLKNDDYEDLSSPEELIAELLRLEEENKVLVRSLRDELSKCFFTGSDDENPLVIVQNLLDDSEEITTSILGLQELTNKPIKLDSEIVESSKSSEPIASKPLSNPVQLSLF